MDVMLREEANAPYFDKYTTNIIKGIALIMMFIHHFFTFPTWWIEGISYPLIEKMAPFFCMPLKLCVSIFCFITGYLYAYNKDKTLRYSLRKISDILISYWCVFLLLAVAAILGVNYQYTLSDFIKECFALYRPTMPFCWYVNFYIVFMLILPLVTRIMAKNFHIDLIITFFCLQFSVRVLDHFTTNNIVNEILKNLSEWFPCVLIGYIFASYGLFEKIYSLNTNIVKREWVNIIIWIFLFFIVPMGQFYEPIMMIAFKRIPTFYIHLDVVYAPIFIYGVVNLVKSINMKYTYKAIFYIGKYSLLMWFISCIFYNNSKTIFQPILYKPHNPVIVTLWGLLICFSIAYFLDILISKLQEFKNNKFFQTSDTFYNLTVK